VQDEFLESVEEATAMIQGGKIEADERSSAMVQGGSDQ